MVRSLVFEDPAVIWLEYYGSQNGFQPDPTPYLDFIAEKSRQFEQKWIQEMASEAVTVCHLPYEVLHADKVRQTIEWMQRGAPVIAQPALWWAPERIYGVPDLIVLVSWLNDKFPGLKLEAKNEADHYVVMDLKFTTHLEESNKAKDLKIYAAQIRIYSFILGHLQDSVPQQAFLITRDRIFNPILVETPSSLDTPFDSDLALMRDRFIDIKLNGAHYLPWKDAIVASNMTNSDERWQTAKQIIASEKTPGRDASLLFQIGSNARRELVGSGFPTLDALLDNQPDDIPFEKIKGFGAKKAGQVRAVLQANRTKVPIIPPPDTIPPRKPFEFFVDYEYFTNINVDFDHQWPTLEGCEMVFMIGLGREEKGTWHYEPLIAATENQEQERVIFDAFIERLECQTSGAYTDPNQTAIYHWSSAEIWQTQRVVDRHQLIEEHSLRKLPWVNLQKVFLDGPAALPDALDFGLKSVAKALGKIDPNLRPLWSEDLEEGQLAMLMGWKAYHMANLLETREMKELVKYLEADCNALWKILRWLRLKT
jgi:hypothetical protein